jgi:hypothetical protein
MTKIAESGSASGSISQRHGSEDLLNMNNDLMSDYFGKSAGNHRWAQNRYFVNS